MTDPPDHPPDAPGAVAPDDPDAPLLTLVPKRHHGDGRANLAPPWQKGQSGNPGGKPRGLEDIAALCRVHTTAAVAGLVRALGNSHTVVQAAVALLDRGYGKIAQHVELSGKDGAPPITVEADRPPIAQLIAAALLRAEAEAQTQANGPIIEGKVEPSA